MAETLPAPQEESHETGRREDGDFLLLLLALAILLFNLFLAANDEPLHIDELRQVGHYSTDLGAVAEGAYSQEQPPLDYWIGSIAAEAGADSDFGVRTPSLVFAWLGTALVAFLLRRSSYERAAWVAVLFVAFSPVFLLHGAYARPYALPFFLMTVSLLSVLKWLRDGHRYCLAIFALAVLLLPYSRTTEPPLFLAALAAILAILAVKESRARWALGMCLISGINGIRILGTVGSETAEYQSSSINSLSTIGNRLIHDTFDTYRAAVPAMVLIFAAALAGAFLLVRRRTELRENWWLAALAAPAILFPVVFVAVSLPSQPFYERYTFFLIPVLAALIGVLIERVGGALWAMILAIVLVPGAVSTVSNLSTQEFGDSAAIIELVNHFRSRGQEVVYEASIPITSWRPEYLPGEDRYSSSETAAITSIRLARSSDLLEPGQNLVIVFRGNLDLEGWASVPTVQNHSILIPLSSPARHDPAEALWEICETMSIDSGGYLCASSIRISFTAGDTDLARSRYDHTLEQAPNDAVRAAISGILADLDLSSVAGQ